MRKFTFQQLNDLKILAVNAHKFDLASTCLSIIKELYPNEYLLSKEKKKVGRPKKNKALVFKNLIHSLVRDGGKPIDVDFMKKLFPETY